MSDNKSRRVFLLLLLSIFLLFRSRTKERREEWRRKKRWGLDGWRGCYTIINGEDVNLVGDFRSRENSSTDIFNRSIDKNMVIG